jgi:acyl carrier protein
MNDTKLEEKVREIVARQFDISVEAVTPGTSLFNLTKDSLDIVELVLALEREFEVKIEDEDLEKLGKIGDLTNYIREKLLCRPSENPEPALGAAE